MKNKLLIIVLSFMIFSPVIMHSQSKEIPLSEEFLANAAQYRIKLGTIVMNRTIPVKIGPYSLKKVKISKDYDEDAKIMGIPVENQYTSTFSTHLKDKQDRTAWIEAAQNINFKEQLAFELNRYIDIGKDSLISDTNVSSVLINTSEQMEDIWLLLMSKTPGTDLFSIRDMRLTNRTEEITFKASASEASGSMLKKTAKILEFQLDGKTVAALQYKTGGAFGYKQYAWISNDISDHMKLLLVASMASILQLTNGGFGYDFTE